MKNKIINIKKDIIKKLNFLKKENKKIILKSIIQNKKIKPIIRSYASKKITELKLNSSISKQNNNICLYTGRIKGVLKLTECSRHTIKKKFLNGSIQNMKIKSW